MRYLIKFSYDGSSFSGYQRQKNLRTVQGEIEKILTSVNGLKSVTISSSGRTDKGVHAINQYAHFDLDVDIKLYNLKKCLNRGLNGDIYIKDIRVVPASFHARYDVVKKTYKYYINMSEFNPIDKNYVLQLNKFLDVDKMISVSKVFLGEHDFRAFCYSEKDQVNCVRCIYDISFDICDDILIISFTGNGFLRKMVRNLVSVLIRVGDGKLLYSDVVNILNSKSKSYNIKCVSSCGLYLEDVFYGDDFYEKL